MSSTDSSAEKRITGTSERREQIIQRLRAQGSVQVNDLSNLYVWHRVVFETSIHSSFVFTNDDEMPDDGTGSETTVYHLLAVIRDGKVIQAHYGPIHIMDRYYDETVTE